MDFDYTPEQLQLRDAVAALGNRYGHGYFVAKAKAGEHTTELWAEAGRLGYLGVNLPEAYGGGGGGITELAIVCEELAAAGRLARHRRYHHREARHRGPAQAAPARPRRRHREDGLRDHRT